jgi:putative transposase
MAKRLSQIKHSRQGKVKRRATGTEKAKTRKSRFKGDKRNPKKGTQVLCKPKFIRYKFMKANETKYKIKNMCKAMHVSVSGYYKHKNLVSDQAKRELQEQIQTCFIKHKGRSGAKKLHAEISKTRNISIATIGRHMRKLGLKAKNRSKFKAKIEKSSYIAENVLNREFTAQKANQKWVSDITYLRVKQSWQYLCVIIDLYSRKVISWKLSNHMESSLVTDVLEQAVSNRKINTKTKVDLLFHSDQGSQYTSTAVRCYLSQNNIRQSMSRRGNCWDNAVAESFFKTLKTELLTDEIWHSERLQQELFEYIDIDYNTKRYHSALGYTTPNNFELLRV